jgi:hypothetical protein
MATISENLQILKDSTDAIKQAIIDKGGTINGDITTWADAISGLSGGGSSSGEEITFTGTMTWKLLNCTITGDLSSRPEDMVSGSLAVAFRNSSGIVMEDISISVNIKNISIICSYDEPPMGNIIPALYIVYETNYETKIVPVKFIQQTPIKFYVNDIEYDALYSMTWEQFINSEYNPTLTDTNGTSYKVFLIKDGVVSYELLYDGELDRQVGIYTTGNKAEISTDTIKENTHYLAD